MSRSKLQALVTMLAVGGGAVANAATTAAPPPDELPTVWVFARAPRALVNVAASVSVTDAATIEGELAQDYRDLTRYTAGLSMRNDPSRFGLDTISIRGIGGNRVLLETDGVPAPSGFAVGSFGDAGRAYADLDLVKRVEILRGPASALYGSDAIGGVVSTRTLDPLDLLGDDDAALRLRSGYFGDDRSYLLSAAGAMRFGAGLETMLAVAHRDGNALRNESRTLGANPRDYTRDTLFARTVVATMEHPLRITLSGERGHATTDVRTQQLQPGRFANTIALEGDDHARQWRALVDQSLTDVGGFDRIEWRAYWQRAATEQDTFEERRAASPRSPAVRIDREFRYRETTIGAEATLARDVRLACTEHRFVFGGEVARSRMVELRDGLQTVLATGAATNVLLGETMPVRDSPRSATTTFGVYLQDEFRPGDGRLALLPALRLDHYRLRPRVDTMYREDNPTQQPVGVTHTSLTPRLGMTWRIADEVALFAQYVRGFRSPPFADVNIGLDIAQFNYRAVPNPDLEPETSDALEIGLRSTRAAFAGSLSAFHTRYRDFIESKVNIGIDPATGATLFQSRNLARAEIYGLEAEGVIRFGEWRSALTPWSARFAVSYARGNDLENDRPLNGVDPLKAVLGLRYAAPAGTWNAELLTTAVAGKDRVSDGTAPFARTAGFVTFDLLAQWRPTARLGVQAGLFNLTDRAILEWADVRERAANDPLLELYRRPGRNVAVSFSYRY